MSASTKGNENLTEAAMQPIRATSTGLAGVPDGTPGTAFQASGFNDPESIEYEAWMFAPDDEPDGAAYYCSRENWQANSKETK